MNTYPESIHSLRAALAVGGRRDPGEDGAEQSGVEVGEPVGAEMGDQDGVDVAGVVELLRYASSSRPWPFHSRIRSAHQPRLSRVYEPACR
jgi:hypothetical protein